jgi:hypothetical protein
MPDVGAVCEFMLAGASFLVPFRRRVLRSLVTTLGAIKALVTFVDSHLGQATSFFLICLSHASLEGNQTSNSWPF